MLNAAIQSSFCVTTFWKSKTFYGAFPNSRQEYLDTMGCTDAMGTTGFYFDHKASKIKITITCIKTDTMNDGEGSSYFPN